MTGRIHRSMLAWAIPIWLALASPAHAQHAAPDPGAEILARLQRANLIDDYYPDAVREVAASLAQAAPGQWRGLRVNEPHRGGWLNVYVVDSSRLDPDEPLVVGDIELTPEALAGGALADEGTGTVYVNAAAWKRMAAASMMKQAGVVDDVTAGLAAVDAYGLQATRRYWDRSTLDADTSGSRITGMLLRGALAFVLAHEMGHLQIGRSAAADAAETRMRDVGNLTERQKDERMACPETLYAEYQQRQRHEQAADMAAVRLLGQQCRIGDDGELRHQIYVLGTSWYFTAAMADKLLQMGRSSDSPFIAQSLRTLIGEQLYELAVAGAAESRRTGGVKAAFPKTHPPDYARAEAIETAFRSTPCGGGDLDLSGMQMMEFYRQSMCSRLTGRQAGQ
jgi:hypothetical protein